MNVLRAENIKQVKAGPSIIWDNETGIEKDDKAGTREGDNKVSKEGDNKVSKRR